MTAEPADNPTFNLQLPAELEYLPTFLDHVRQAIEVAGLADAHGIRLELAVEEALVNVFNLAEAIYDLAEGPSAIADADDIITESVAPLERRVRCR